ncbi:MAG TPA: hypothetical protein VHP63_01055, partial [candidate division Zixibacteria bacterium]|nr:hypothetical protein [candidate division Zixibacteria bacterium]
MNQVKTLFLLAILFFSSYAKADQLLTVKIGKLMDAQQGSVVELPVFLTNSDYAIKSFDFLLTFDTKVFFLQSVIPATTTDNGICYWDRFDVYDCTKKDKDSLCPRGT